MTASPTIVLVRHAQTRAHAEAQNLISGWTDRPLDSTGKKQAERLAEKVVKQFHPVKMFASDLERARQTAKEIIEDTRETDKRALPVSYTSDLRSWNLGSFQGKPAQKVKDEVDSLMAHPGVKAPGGEAYGTFVKRFLNRMRQILALAKQSDGPIVVVTHTRSILATRGWVKAGTQGTEIEKSVVSGGKHIDAGTGMVLTLTNGRWKASDFNADA